MNGQGYRLRSSVRAWIPWLFPVSAVVIISDRFDISSPVVPVSSLKLLLLIEIWNGF